MGFTKLQTADMRKMEHKKSLRFGPKWQNQVIKCETKTLKLQEIHRLTFCLNYYFPFVSNSKERNINEEWGFQWNLAAAHLAETRRLIGHLLLLRDGFTRGADVVPAAGVWAPKCRFPRPIKLFTCHFVWVLNLSGWIQRELVQNLKKSQWK